jgi:hypothetical protein
VLNKILFFLLICSQVSFSQFKNLQNFDERDLRFGYYIGINQYDNKIIYKNNTPHPISIDRAEGINVGLIGELKLSKNLFLSLEPGLHANKKNIIFNEREEFTNYGDTLWVVKSNNIHIPLLLKYSAKRLNNFRPYLKAGLSTSINLNEIEGTLSNNGLENFKFEKFNFYYELAFGVDFYLRYFKFSPSIRGVFSLKNEIPNNTPDNPWTRNVDKFLTRAIFINFSFY